MQTNFLLGHVINDVFCVCTEMKTKNVSEDDIHTNVHFRSIS